MLWHKRLLGIDNRSKSRFKVDEGSTYFVKLKIYFKPFIIALIGLIVRMLIGVEGIHGTDILFHVEGVRSVLITGSPYCLSVYNYPPLYAYLQLIGITVIGWNPLGYKFMPILFDTALSILIYLTLRNLGVNEKQSIIVQTLWCFNPLAIVASSWYGLFDSIPTLFALLSILFIVKQKFIASALILSLGIATKVFPAVLLPINIFALYTKSRGKRSLIYKYLVTVFLAVTVIELLTTFKCVSDAVKDQLLFHIERTDKGLSITPLYPYSSAFSLIIAMIFPLAFLLRVKPAIFSDSDIYTISAIASMFLVIVNPFVYPHYMIWFLPLVLVALTIILSSTVKVLALNLTLILMFSAIGLVYWKCYKVHVITEALQYIFNICLLTIIIVFIRFYLMSLRQGLKTGSSYLN